MALGLDKGDALVRRRMRLKMEFLMNSAASIIEPADGELAAFFKAHARDYEQEPRVAFEQIYLGEHPDAAGVAAALRQMRAEPDADLDTLGPRSQLPAQMGLSTSDAVTGVFGRGFFEAVLPLDKMRWSGPVRSTYGVHLVRVLDLLPARVPPMAEVRDAVLRDWRTAKRAEVQDRDYAERRKNYVVEIDRGDAGADP